MLRLWFLFIIVVGVLSSGLSNCGGRVETAADGAGKVNRLDSADLARIRARSSDEDTSSAFGDSLALHREADGHFYADTEINGAVIRMLVDTGATAIALSRDDARRAGVGISIGMPNVVGQGASGEVKGEFVTLGRVSLGGKTAESMPAVVLDGGDKSLLGQTFLSRFASVEIHGDTMVLR